MKKKKAVKKIKSATKKIKKKTKSLLKKTRAIESRLEKQWKKERPQREKLKKVGSKALEHGIKIGGDVFETIRKDINEIKKQGKTKKAKK